MPRLVILVALFLVVFLAALVWRMPASFVFERAGLPGGAVSFTYVGGTVWEGTVSGLNVGGQPLGQVRFKLRPGALVAGRLVYDVRVSGETAEARGTVGIGLDRSVALTDAFADINIQALRRLDPRLRQAPAKLQVTLDELRLDRRRACRAGDGALSTDLLMAAGRRWNWQGPDMLGEIACRDGAFQVRLESAPGPDRIEADAVLNAASLRYNLTARVESAHPGLGDAMRVLDFTAEDGAYVYQRTNAPAAVAIEQEAMP